MGNFLTGLVRRGAGLPLPVTLRPAVGPQQRASSFASSDEASEQAPDVAGAPVSPGGPATDRETQHADRALQPRESILHPRARILPGPTTLVHERTEETAAKIERWSSQRTPPSPLARPQSETRTEIAEDVHLAPQRVNADASRSASEPQITARRVLPFSGEREVAVTAPPIEDEHPPQSPRPIPESPAARSENALEARPTRSAPDEREVEPMPRPKPAHTAQRENAAKAGPEPHTIQVKIGRVEIRSNQPPPVARPARPARVSGFDDFRMARNYLDRNFDR